jgi:23S rRNA (guanine2445-N2)-methyltransferase / 23S rRNA (guanine2069-N7)-methyltransferase
MPGGVRFCGDLRVGYRAVFESRVASRVLLVLAQWPSGDAQDLYENLSRIDFSQHLAATDSIAIDAHIARSDSLRHPTFVAQKTKDAICDWFRRHDPQGRRPNVDLDRADHHFFVFVGGRFTELSLDLGGASLHRRGYRVAQGAAPLKENVAAAILLRSSWQNVLKDGGAFVDPMCGSGTFVIEAALIAGDIAPGLLREEPSLLRWKGHDAVIWAEVVESAQTRRDQRSNEDWAPIVGCDRDPIALSHARACVHAAGLQNRIALHHADALALPASAPTGLLVCNPPWGLRLGSEEEAAELYRQMGQNLIANFRGWQASILIGAPHLGRALGLHARKRWDLDNGGVACQVLHLDLSEKALADPQNKPREKAEVVPPIDLVNRLRKNLKHSQTWRKRENVCAYRLYDSDLPDYAVAVDVYGEHVHVQEYAAPEEIPPEIARKRFHEALAAVREVLEVPRERVHIKQRRRQHQREGEQYQRLGEAGVEFPIQEGRARLLVNLDDYLDTGLFLDHRPMRQWIANNAAGQRFLNLFCYTASVSVHAILGGAKSSTSVDTSTTYLDWARRNYELNGIRDGKHELVRADCREWLQRHAHLRYDLIFLDPPTFSNSKRSPDTFDVIRDHLALIDDAMALLDDNGILIFSTNARRFVLDEQVAKDYDVEDWSAKSIGSDFARQPKIHRCFCIRWPATSST